MESGSSTLKKVICRDLPRVDRPHTADLNSSQPIGGAEDTAMSARKAIEASLAALNVANALAAKVPFISGISPVAGLLLQALTIWSEVKQHKEEWDIVMVKLKQVADLVDNLEEKDLPLSLRGIFQSLKIELDRIKGALKQSKEIGRFKSKL